MTLTGWSWLVINIIRFNQPTWPEFYLYGSPYKQSPSMEQSISSWVYWTETVTSPWIQDQVQYFPQLTSLHDINTSYEGVQIKVPTNLVTPGINIKIARSSRAESMLQRSAYSTYCSYLLRCTCNNRKWMENDGLKYEIGTKILAKLLGHWLSCRKMSLVWFLLWLWLCLV